MKSFRTTLAAAAMLVAPTAALLVATPAAAEHRAVVASEHGSHRVYRDQRAPQIVDVTPEPGQHLRDRGRTRITARFVEEGSGIDSVWLRIDGRDVSRHVRFDGEEVRYRADLAPGRHRAEVVVRDRAGNVNRRAWVFAVLERDRRDHHERSDGYERRDGYGYYGQPPVQRW